MLLRKNGVRLNFVGRIPTIAFKYSILMCCPLNGSLMSIDLLMTLYWFIIYLCMAGLSIASVAFFTHFMLLLLLLDFPLDVLRVKQSMSVQTCLVQSNKNQDPVSIYKTSQHNERNNNNKNFYLLIIVTRQRNGDCNI